MERDNGLDNGLDQDERFGGISRLYGSAGASRVASARVAVVGVGGVGGWVAEALVRTGCLKVILMDLDDVCVTNINRQVHATGETIGQPKTGAMAERLRVVSPGCVVEEVREFYDASTEEQLFGLNPSLVIDAVDSTADKARLIAAATRRGVPVVTVGAAGGRRDPASVRRGDLGATGGDPLLREVRRRLRAEQGWAVAERAPWGVPAVFSVERAVYPTPKGETCDTPSPGARVHLDCRSGYGTSAMVAGTFGLTAAAIAVDLLIAS